MLFLIKLHLLFQYLGAGVFVLKKKHGINRALHIFPNGVCMLRNKTNLLKARRYLLSEIVSVPNHLSQLLARFGTTKTKTHLGRTARSFLYRDTPFLPEHTSHSRWEGTAFPPPSPHREEVSYGVSEKSYSPLLEFTCFFFL